MYTYIYIYSPGPATTADLLACRSPWRRKVQDQGDHQALPGGPAEIVPVCSLLKTIASVNPQCWNPKGVLNHSAPLQA